jgi:hypothetical protein
MAGFRGHEFERCLTGGQVTDLQQEEEQMVVADMQGGGRKMDATARVWPLWFSGSGRVGFCRDFVAQSVAQNVADCAQMRSFYPTDAAVSR